MNGRPLFFHKRRNDEGLTLAWRRGNFVLLFHRWLWGCWNRTAFTHGWQLGITVCRRATAQVFITALSMSGLQAMVKYRGRQQEQIIIGEQIEASELLVYMKYTQFSAILINRHACGPALKRWFYFWCSFHSLLEETKAWGHTQGSRQTAKQQKSWEQMSQTHTHTHT